MSDDVLGTADNKQVDDDVLGGAPEVEDITETVTPEDFDFDAFVAGVRPGRRAVRVTMCAYLVAETEQLGIQFDDLDDADKDGEQDEQMLVEYQALNAKNLDYILTCVLDG